MSPKLKLLMLQYLGTLDATEVLDGLQTERGIAADVLTAFEGWMQRGGQIDTEQFATPLEIFSARGRLTQAQAATMMPVSTRTWNSWENGRSDMPRSYLEHFRQQLYGKNEGAHYRKT